MLSAIIKMFYSLLGSLLLVGIFCCIQLWHEDFHLYWQNVPLAHADSEGPGQPAYVHSLIGRAPDKMSIRIKIIFFYFSTKLYVCVRHF